MLFRLFEHLVRTANVAVLFDVQAVFEGFFVFVRAIAEAFAFFALQFDGVILRHIEVKKEWPHSTGNRKKVQVFVVFTQGTVHREHETKNPRQKPWVFWSHRPGLNW